MKQRSWLQRAYLGLLVLLGLASVGAVASRVPAFPLPSPWLGGVVVVAFLLANLAVVRLETSTPDSPVFINTAPGPFIFSVLVLGPVGLPLLLLAEALGRWLRQQGRQPLGYIFNAVDTSTSYLIMLALSEPIHGALEHLHSASSVGWLLLVLLAYPLHNVLYGSLLTAIGTGRPALVTARELYLPTAWVDWVPLSLGVLAAALFATTPALLLLVLVPFALTYQSLRAIARWLAASEELRSTNAALEQRVAERTHALSAANDELARIQRHREEEVTNAAHDINQVLRAAVQTIGLRAGSASLRQELVRLLTPAMDVLEDMKLAARLRNDSLALNPQPTNLVALVAEAAQHCRPRYELAGCALSVEVLDEVPPLLCDGPRLRRVLLNLLDNALTHTCQREDGEVTLSLAVDGPQLVLAVSDNGGGLAPEHLARIGERFYRVAQGVERPEGSGIGLACSTKIVALSGGSLRIHSDGPGCGTTVTVTLPNTAAPVEPPTNRTGLLSATA